MTDVVWPESGKKASGPGDRLLPIEHVKAKFSMGRTWVYSQCQRGLLPCPLKLGRSSRWSERQINLIAEAYARGASKGEIAALVAAMGGASR